MNIQNKLQVYLWMVVIQIKFWLLSKKVHKHVEKRERIVKKLNDQYSRNRLNWAYEGSLGKDGKGQRDLSESIKLLVRP